MPTAVPHLLVQLRVHIKKVCGGVRSQLLQLLQPLPHHAQVAAAQRAQRAQHGIAAGSGADHILRLADSLRSRRSRAAGQPAPPSPAVLLRALCAKPLLPSAAAPGARKQCVRPPHNNH